VAGAIGNLDDEVELREQRLPAAPDWQKATAHASRVLGVPASPLLSAANVAQFASEVRKAVDAKRADVEALAKEIRERLSISGSICAGGAPENRECGPGPGFAVPARCCRGRVRAQLGTNND